MILHRYVAAFELGEYFAMIIFHVSTKVTYSREDNRTPPPFIVRRKCKSSKLNQAHLELFLQMNLILGTSERCLIMTVYLDSGLVYMI